MAIPIVSFALFFVGLLLGCIGLLVVLLMPANRRSTPVTSGSLVRFMRDYPLGVRPSAHHDGRACGWAAGGGGEFAVRAQWLAGRMPRSRNGRHR